MISRDARETVGALVRGTLGGNERTAVARSGVELGATGAARVYANWFDREDMLLSSRGGKGSPAAAPPLPARGGARAPGSMKLRELANQRRRFGYRRLHILLRRESVMINRKKTQRIYQEEGLAVRRRRSRRRSPLL